MKQYLYHLSHIDLDGYGCQYLTQQCFDTIHCYNANYGPEVSARVDEIIKQIKQDKFLYGETIETLILITDLNLTSKEASSIEKKALEVGTKLQLLDHHGTGKSASEKFLWYTLDTTKCATLITYNWLKKVYQFDKENKLSPMVYAINAIDIWISDDQSFEYGKVMLGMISGAREINRTLFPTQDRAFKLHMIKEANKILGTEDAPIQLDDNLHQIKKDFFKQDKNDTKDNLVAHYVSQMLTKERQRLTITYRGYKGILGYNIGNTSIIGNKVMVDNSDYDFYMDINFRGGFSLRSNNKVDVSLMAQTIGKGGGHPNASGGKIEGYKDSFIYSDVRAFVQNYIDQY